ncbi:5-oxoprolinase subunit PxpB [bacterium]|nr:5-oxoprolinase subunit PxpB [bacterium]
MAVRMLAAGEQGLVVEFGDSIDSALNDRVHAFCRRLHEAKLPGVIEIVPTYRSALVMFDPFVITRAELQSRADSMLEAAGAATGGKTPRLVRIPVCYGGEFGPDLEFVAGHNHLSPDDVIRIHSARPLKIYMLGFMPGFPYLGGMDGRIAAPRLRKPRIRIPAGSVGIAGTQTGFYPYESPGGWRLIGRTPIKPFNPASHDPFLYSAGDYLQFRPITNEEYERIRRDAEGGRYQPEVGEP